MCKAIVTVKENFITVTNHILKTQIRTSKVDTTRHSLSDQYRSHSIQSSSKSVSTVDRQRLKSNNEQTDVPCRNTPSPRTYHQPIAPQGSSLDNTTHHSDKPRQFTTSSVQHKSTSSELQSTLCTQQTVSSIDRQHLQSKSEQIDVSRTTDPGRFHRQVGSSLESHSTAHHRDLSHQVHPTVARSEGHSSSLNLGFQRRHNTGKCDRRPSDQGSHSHFSAAEILLQDSPSKTRERLTSVSEQFDALLSGSRSGDSGHQHPLKRPRLESDIDLQQERESSAGQQQRPNSLTLSTYSSSSHSLSVSPSPEFETSLADNVASSSSSSRQRTETHNIPGRGKKRVAHKSDKDIKSQRQGIKHKLLTPVSPIHDAPPPKRPRKGSHTSNAKGIRADLLKKMSKK